MTLTPPSPPPLPRRQHQSLFVARMLVWLAAAASISLTVWLGLWQMGRADEKLARQAERDARAQQAPWQAADWPCEGDASSIPDQQPVRLTGHWVAERSVLLENRPMGGQVGFVLLTPLKVDAPAACADRWVLVQRGWLPRDPADRTRVPPLPGEDGPVLVVGHVEPQASRVYALGDEGMPQGGDHPPIRQNADDPFWRAWLGSAQGLRPGVLVQTTPTEPTAPTGDGLRRDWPAPDLGVSTHHGYAAQWFGLAALLAGLTVWFQIIRPQRARPARSDPHDVTQS